MPFLHAMIRSLRQVEAKPRPTLIDLSAELRTVLQALAAAGVPHALVRTLALMVYQPPGTTVDIDLVLPAETIETRSTALAPFGFRDHSRLVRFEASQMHVYRFCVVEPGRLDVLMRDCLLTTHQTVAEL